MRELHLTNEHWEIMRRHVAACAPEEGCGLLAGLRNHVNDVFEITNELRSASRFRMDPSEQIRAFATIESKGLELVGIFHSHPAPGGALANSGAIPSPTDIAEAAYPVAQVVWSRSQGVWAARAYWIESGAISEIAIEIDDME